MGSLGRAMKVSRGRVLVTGASRGIGRAVVEWLVVRGASVVAVGRDQRALLALAQETDPSRVTVAVGDLRDREQRDRLVDEAWGVYAGLDGMVSCAGIAHYAQVGAIDEADVEELLAVNFVAPLFLSQALAVRLREQGTGGAIVHVASTLATHPAPGTTAYAATKSAVLSLTRSLAMELAPEAIRVNAVAPGVVDTAMVRVPRLAPDEVAPEGDALEQRIDAELDALRRLHPLGRLGRPEDVAAAVVHLLDAPWTTGTVLTVDGGLTLGG